jgi:hypothetical protein
MNYSTKELIKLIDDNEPIAMTDKELKELAWSVMLELRSRVSLTAIRNGDLDEEYEDEARLRRIAFSAVGEINSALPAE